MLRSVVSAPPHHRRRRISAVIGGLAVLTLTLPGIAAYADDDGQPVTGTLTGTVSPAPTSGMMTVWQRVQSHWVRSGPAELSEDGGYTAPGLPVGTYAVTYSTADLGDHDVNADGALGRPSDAQQGATIADAEGATLDFAMPELSASLTIDGVTDAAGAPLGASAVGLYALADEGEGPEWLNLRVAPTADPVTGVLRFAGLPAATYAVAVFAADDHVYLSDGTRVKTWDENPPVDDGSLGVALGSGAHRFVTVTLRTPPPYVPPVVVDPTPTPSPTPSTTPSATPSATPSPVPSVPAKPTASPTSEPVRITGAPVPSVIQVGQTATPQIAIVPATAGGDSLAARDQNTVNNALAAALLAAQLQSAATGGPVPSGPSVQPLIGVTGPGLYLRVIDGLLTVSNNGGMVPLAAGQFGFTPDFVTPPIVLPRNPGIVFAPPPAFTTSVTTDVTRSAQGPKKNAIDCEVRRADATSAQTSPTKQYCNRLAVPRASTHGKHHAHHKAWKRHVTVTAKRGKHHVRTPALRVPGAGWYRIVTTHHLVLRFTAISDHGHRPKHPIRVTRTAAVRSVTFVHVTRP